MAARPWEDTEHSLNTLRHACIMDGQGQVGRSATLQIGEVHQWLAKTASWVRKWWEMMIDDDQWIFKGSALFPRVHAADKTTIIKSRIDLRENLQETMGFYKHVFTRKYGVFLQILPLKNQPLEIKPARGSKRRVHTWVVAMSPKKRWEKSTSGWPRCGYSPVITRGKLGNPRSLAWKIIHWLILINGGFAMFDYWRICCSLMFIELFTPDMWNMNDSEVFSDGGMGRFPELTRQPTAYSW